MATARFTRFLGFASVGMIAAIVLLLAFLKTPPPPLFPPLPNPNGYDDFMRAARLLNGPIPDATNHSPAQMRAFAEQNQAALQAIQTGLGRECRVPLEFSQAYLTGHMKELESIKVLAQFLRMVGRSAQADGRNQEANRWHLDAIRLGQAVSRGGLLIDVMVGQACQAIGLKGLRALHHALTPAEISENIRALEAVDHMTEPVSEVLARERVYFQKAYGWWQTTMPRLIDLLRRASGRPPILASALSAAENSLLRGRARFRLALLEMAIEASKATTGQYPGSLAAISAKLSNEVRSDPFNGLEFVYRLRDDGYLLYSVGPDRKDDGGRPIARQSGSGVPAGDLLPE